MVGIYFLQLMLLAVLLVNRFPYALLVLPLLVFTVVFHIVQSNQFKRPWTLGNAREAAMLDARDSVSVRRRICGWRGGGVHSGVPHLAKQPVQALLDSAQCRRGSNARQTRACKWLAFAAQGCGLRLQQFLLCHDMPLLTADEAEHIRLNCPTPICKVQCA